MTDYMVKIRIPQKAHPKDDEYIFETCHYCGEDPNPLVFRKHLFDGVWRIGYTHGDWMGADKVWIFQLTEVVTK